MKKNLTLIAFVATAFLCSCGGSEKSETTIQQEEKPKVKIAQVTAQDVAQLPRPQEHVKDLL